MPEAVSPSSLASRAGRLLVKAGMVYARPGPATADQQSAGCGVYVPSLQGHGLADTQPGSPHDERRHPGAAMPQGRQGVQKPLDLLGVPVVRNNHLGTFTPKVPIRAI